MRLEIEIPKHHYNNIMALDSVSLGRVPYKGIIMYTINAIKHGRVLEQEPTTKNDLGVDCISRDDVRDVMQELWGTSGELLDRLMSLPSVTPQEPKTWHCKDCKWWKDSDGVYRRGVGAESQCPINRREVFEGNGYCYLYEPQESEDV